MSSNTGYRVIADLAVHYENRDIKPKLGMVEKRIYLDCYLVYIIASDQGRFSSLAASGNEKTVFTDLVSICYTEETLFLEDSRNIPVRVRNLELSEEDVQQYLCSPDDVLHIPRDHVRIMVTCEHCRCKIPIKSLQKHLRKVHGK